MSTSKRSLIWFLLIIFLLSALSGYLWYSNSQLKSDFRKQETEVFELEKVQSELDKDYQDALESIESLRDESKDLNALIESQKTELKSRKDRINGLIWSKRELDKARDEIAQFKGVTDQYITEINQLKAQAQRLQSQNKSLTKDKEVLTVSLDEKTKMTEELAVAKTILTEEKAELQLQKDKLSTKVDVASVIKLNWLQVKAYELKDNNELKHQKKAKNANVLRICFKTETNLIAEKGDQKFQVRYIDPTGETLAVEALGSGVVYDNYSNQNIRYSVEDVVDYGNQEQEECIDWQLNYPLIKGEYEVFVYNNGFECGKGNFKLK